MLNGRTISRLFLALLAGFYVLTALGVSLDLLAERSRGVSAPDSCVCRLLEANEHCLRQPVPQTSTPQEFAESESEATDEDERYHLEMSFSQLLPPSGPNPVRAMVRPSGRPAPRGAAPLSLLSQRLIC